MSALVLVVGGTAGLVGGAWMFAQPLRTVIEPALGIPMLFLATLFGDSTAWTTMFDGWGPPLSWFAGSIVLFGAGWVAIVAGLNSFGPRRGTDGPREES